jgi:hypothetical protein
MKKTARTYDSPILEEFIALENPELTAVLETKMRLAAKIFETMQAKNINKSALAA